MPAPTRNEDALSPTQHAPGGHIGAQLSLPLPGVDHGEWPTVAPGATQGRQGRPPNPSVQAGRRPAPTGSGGEGRQPRDGAPAEVQRSPDPAVPAVQPNAGGARRAGYAGATVPSPEVERAALAKAQERDWWRLVSYQHDQGCWYVPSRTTPGEFYVVRVRRGSERSHPAWWRLECNCPAEDSGRYLACWHKYACWLRFQQPANGKTGDARRGSSR